MLNVDPHVDKAMTTVSMLSSYTLKNMTLEKGRVYTLNNSVALSLINKGVADVSDGSLRIDENKMIKIKYEE